MSSLVPGRDSHNRHLSYDEVENNIGGLPVTDNRIQELFDSLDIDHSGAIPVELLKGFFLSLESYGVDYTEEEAEAKVRRYATTDPDALAYDEFACFILSIAQW